MSLDIDTLAQTMLSAAQQVVGQQWPSVRAYFESETQMYAQRIASVAAMWADGLISESRAKDHLALQNQAWETTLLAVQGLSQLMVEASLNAALQAVRDMVNTAVGFALL